MGEMYASPSRIFDALTNTFYNAFERRHHPRKVPPRKVLARRGRPPWVPRKVLAKLAATDPELSSYIFIYTAVYAVRAARYCRLLARGDDYVRFDF